LGGPRGVENHYEIPLFGPNLKVIRPFFDATGVLWTPSYQFYDWHSEKGQKRAIISKTFTIFIF